MDVDDNELAGELVMRLFNSRTSAHVHHLQTRSYAQHVALNEYYDAIVGLADSFAEKYQGCYGILSYPAISYTASSDFITELTALRAWIKKRRAQITDESELQNEIDEIMSQIDETLYKLRFLK